MLISISHLQSFYYLYHIEQIFASIFHKILFFIKFKTNCFTFLIYKKVQIPSLYLYFFPYIFKIPPIVLFMAPECVDKIEAPPAKITTSPSCT